MPPFYRMPTGRFPTQDGAPVLISRLAFEACCCGEPDPADCYTLTAWEFVFKEWLEGALDPPCQGEPSIDETFILDAPVTLVFFAGTTWTGSGTASGDPIDFEMTWDSATRKWELTDTVSSRMAVKNNLPMGVFLFFQDDCALPYDPVILNPDPVFVTINATTEGPITCP
jgi:hypothetical protein